MYEACDVEYFSLSLNNSLSDLKLVKEVIVLATVDHIECQLLHRLHLCQKRCHSQSQAHLGQDKGKRRCIAM